MAYLQVSEKNIGSQELVNSEYLRLRLCATQMCSIDSYDIIHTKSSRVEIIATES